MARFSSGGGTGMGDSIGHTLAGIFWLILAGLLLTHWTAVNTVAGTGFTGGETVIAELENPGKTGVKP